MLGALEGGWVAPEAGGDLLRDGPGVLPTGGWVGVWHAIFLHLKGSGTCGLNRHPSVL